jgi:hypothetical protein
MVLWVPDRTMGCPHCGPWVREQKARGYLAKIGTTPLYKRVVARSAWASLSRRLRRASLDYLQVPADDDQRVVLATGGPGELVADNEAEVLAAIAAYPAKCGMNISASTDWQPASNGDDDDQALPGDDDVQVEGYDFRFLVAAGLEHARHVARDLGLYVGEAPGRGGAAFLLRKPDDPLAWGRWRRWAQVEAVEELQRRREEAPSRREAAARRKGVAA